MKSAVSTDRNAPPPRQRGSFAAARFGATLALLLVVGSLLFAQPGAPVEEGPLSIQRLIIPPARIAKELEKAQQGTLILAPLQEFDARVERARQTLKARAEKPRLTRSHYTAELVDRALTNGSGQWTVQYAGALPAILPIDPLNLALTRMKWELSGEAILAAFDPKTFGLLVPPGDSSTCLFDWSARGTPTNDGLVFNLLVPPCPITTFELKVPADYWLSTPKTGAIVTGPHDAGSPGLRLWKLQVTGPTQLEINLRKIADPKGPGPTIFARVQSVQQLGLDRVLIDHDFQIDVLHGSLRELVLHGDATLEPYEVSLKTGDDVKSWQWKELPAKKDAKGKDLPAAGALTIQFRQPVQGKLPSLRVRSLAPRPSGILWTSPALRVEAALSRGETLALHLPADVPLGKWSPGSFQLTGLLTESDGMQILTLAEPAFVSAASRRPTLTFPLKGVDVATTEQYHWHITPRGAELNAEIQFAAARGTLFELPIKLPAGSGYQVEALELSPPELLRGWQPSGDFLVVELKQPLSPGKKVVVKLQLRAGFRAPLTASRDLTCPALQPIDGARREGTLTVTVDPSLQGQMLETSAPLDPASGPGQGTPTWRLTFRGQGVKALMRVAPLPVHVQLRGKHAVILAEQESDLQFRWETEPLAGAPDFLDFRLAPDFPAAWKIKAEDGAVRIHHWERLDGPKLGEARWRFHLAEPLRKKGHFTLEAVASAGMTEAQRRRLSLAMPRAAPWELLAGALATDLLPRSNDAKVWSIPLMTPVQSAVLLDQEMRVDSTLEPIDKFAGAGSLLARSSAGVGKTSLQLQLQQEAGPESDRPASLLLWTHPEKRAASPTERCDQASITTCIRRDGGAWQRISFRLWHWRERTLEVPFPAGSAVVAVKLNNRWLERQDLKQEADGARLTLPFDQNVDHVRYEIYVRSEATEILPGLMRVGAPAFAWPVAPLDLQRRVCLENGWMPLDQEAMSPLGVPACIAGQSETLRWPGRLWNLTQSWSPFGAQADLLDQLSQQRLAVLLAEKQLRDAGAGKAIKLGDALEQLALKHLKDATPLVVDPVALRSLGLTTETMVPASALGPQGRPFWECLGLVYEPCPSGALLTSPRRLRRMGIDSPAQAADLDPAIQEAILHGRDSAGGFLSILAWLRLPPGDTHAFFSDVPASSAEHNGDFSDLAEWAFLADGEHADGFFVFDPHVARILTIVLAMLAAVLLWKLQRAVTPIVCFRAHAVMLTGSVLAVIWWPASAREFVALPVLAVVVVSLFACLLRLVRMKDGAAHTGESTIVKPAAKVAGLALLLLAFTWGAAAQPVTPPTYSVFIIDGKKPMVLVPPELSAKLDEWEKPSIGTQGAILVQAKYSGKVKDGLAKFDVEYQIHSSQVADLVVPLAGVQLQEGAFLDGVPVYPAPHKSGYVLPIKTRGAHHLRLSFAVRVGSVNDHLELKFTIPKLAQNAVQVEWAAPVQALHCQHCWGEEIRTMDARQALKEWHAQLGGENAVNLRWTNLGAVPSPKAIEVQEAHFWDLRPGSASLSSVLHYSVGAGTLTQITVGMPEALHVRGVEASGLAPAPATPLLLKSWQIIGKGGQRRLIVELAQPTAGTIALNLDIVPLLSMRERKLLLPLPVPALQQGKVAGLLGYRLDADENPSAQDLVVQSITPEEFDPLWKKAGGPPVASVSRAYRFKRSSPQAGLEIDLRGESRQAQFHLQWGLDLHHADLLGKFSVRSSHEDLMLLEFFVDPALTLTEVAGADVKRWHLQDTLLQVWLRQPRKQTTVDLVGWRALAYKNDPAAKRSQVLPRVFPLGAQIAQADLELRPAAGIHVDQELVRRLRAPYDVAVSMRMESKPPEASSLTKIQGTPQGVEIWHSIFLPTEQGRLPSLKLQIKDWQGEPPTVDAPGAKVRPIADKERKHLAWTIQYPSGLPQKVVVTVRGRIDKDKQGRVGLPAIELDGARIGQAFVAWQEVELLSGGKKLANQRGVKEILLKQTSADWLRESPGWSSAEARVSLQAALPKTPTRTSVRVLTSAETVRRVEGHWLHEASFWIHAAEAAELRFRWAADIESFSALTDQRLQAAWSPSAREIVLPLDASPEPRFVQLRWHDASTAQTPNLTALQLDSAVLPSQQRVLWIPAGMSAGTQPAPTLFEQLLHEAHGHVQIAAALAEEPVRTAAGVKQIASRQQQFYACVRQAEYALGSAKSVQHDFDSAAALERLNELKRKNAELAKERRYDEQRAGVDRAKKIVWAVASVTDAVPLGTPVLLPPATSSLTLQPEPARLAAEHRARSELILLGAIFLLVFSYFRHSVALARRFAPEIGIALCAAAMLVVGVNVIILTLIGMLLLLRLVWVASALKSRFGAQGATVTAPQPGPEPRSAPPSI
jgi:hypothetical protein